jgi:hypothetical protein
VKHGETGNAKAWIAKVRRGQGRKMKKEHAAGRLF